MQNNETIIRNLFNALNRFDLDALEEFISPDIIIHDPMMGIVEGTEAFRGLCSLFVGAFPDLVTTVTRVVSEGEYGAALHVHEGTHLGKLMGIPPGGRKISVEGLELFRIVDGKITEFWRHDDDAGLMRQIGAMPEPAQAEG